MDTFTKLVTEKMYQQRISIRKLAREAGLDPSFLSKVLTGKRSPPWDEKILKKLAKILGLDPVFLIVSTGRIPSELKPLMENPKVLESLLSHSLLPSSQRRAEPEIKQKTVSTPSFKREELFKSQKKIKKFEHLPKSIPLSEDLL